MAITLTNYTNTLGLRTSATFSSDRRPGSWREGILFEEPNGDYLLTGLSSQFPKERLVGDTKFNWFTESLPNQKGTITGIYSDEDLGTAYTSGGVAGQQLYVKMTAAHAKEFVPNHVVLLRDNSDPRVDCRAWVTSVKVNGANSRLGLKLIEADDNSPDNDLSDANTVLVIGSAFPEASGIPQMLDSEPIKIYNQAQIFQTSFKVSRTMKKIALRGSKNPYLEKLEKARKRHMMSIEKALLWGKYATLNEGTDEEVRFTWGLIPFIEEYAAINVLDYTLDTEFTGMTWEEGGRRWLNKSLKQIFQFGGGTRMGLAGTGAILGINELVELYGNWTLTSGTNRFGLGMVTWVTPFGEIATKTHPLFSHDDVDNHTIILFEPGGIKQRIVDDTFLKKDNERLGGQMSIDGTVEVFITELGFEFHKVTGWGILRGVGQDNELT
jgi:hypothetical protein